MKKRIILIISVGVQGTVPCTATPFVTFPCFLSQLFGDLPRKLYFCSRINA